MTPTAIQFAHALDKYTRHTDDFRTCCGCHGSDNPTSLSFKDGDKGILFTCFSGRDCTHDLILDHYQRKFPHLWENKSRPCKGGDQGISKMYAASTPKSDKSCKEKSDPYTLKAKSLNELLPLIKIRNKGKATKAWAYYKNGKLIGARVRYEWTDGTPKDVKPWRYDGDGVWVNKAFEMVLYWPAGEPPADTNKLCVGVEGEKTADALQADFPQYHVFSPQGGTKAFKKADVSAVLTPSILFPDADNPDDKGEILGIEAMKALATKLQSERGLASEMVDIIGFKDTYDYADGAPPGYRIEDVHQRIQDAEQRLLNAPVVSEWPEITSIEGIAPGEMFGQDKAPFPVEAFNQAPWLMNFATELATQYNMPVECTAMFSLGMVSAAIQTTVRIEGKPGWIQRPNLYMMGIYAPGSTKSAILEDVTRPAVEWERRIADSGKSERINAANEEKIIRSRQAAIVNKSKNAKTTVDRKMMTGELSELDAELEALPPRKPRRLIYSDFTEESLFAPLSEKQNLESGFILSAEAAKLYDILGGLHSNGKGSCSLLQQGYDSERYVRDRQSTGTSILEKPTLTIIQMTQPKPFDNVINGGIFTERGLIQRFILLRGTIDFANYDVDAPPVSDKTKDAYSKTITHLLETKHEDTLLKLSPEAAAQFREFRQYLMPNLDPQKGEFGDDGIAEWGAKHAARILRIAACLHTAAHPIDYPGRDVSGETMTNSIAIGHYILDRANDTLGIVQELPVRSNAIYALKHLRKLASRNGDIAPVKRTELWDNVKRRMDTAEVFEEALAMLEENGYLKTTSVKAPGAKKPAHLYHLNPAALPSV